MKANIHLILFLILYTAAMLLAGTDDYQLAVAQEHREVVKNER